jgi:hypothetical protein
MKDYNRVPQSAGFTASEALNPGITFDNTLSVTEVRSQASSEIKVEKPKRALTTHPHFYHPSRWSSSWWWEWSSVVVAVGCLAGMIALLLSVRDKPVPKWPSGISVNAILSVLVTVQKGAMGVIIAECLSQLKWSWFKKERKLEDLSTFDEATRGVWGAGVLLVTPRAWYLAYSGAFLFIAAFMIGPTVQQSVTVKIRVIESDSSFASMPVCNQTAFDVMGTNGAGPGDNRVRMPILGAMYNGLLQTGSQNPISPICPSGNCTFPAYQSLGFCSECQDISDQIVYTVADTGNNTGDGLPPANSTLSAEECRDADFYCNAQLPAYGLNLRDYGARLNSTVDYFAPDIDFTLISGNETTDPRVGSFTGLMATDNTPQERRAVSCAMRLCIKTFEGSVSQGKFSETLKASNWEGSHVNGTGQVTFGNSITIHADPCLQETLALGSVNGGLNTACVWQIEGGNALALRNSLESLTTGDAYSIGSTRISWSNDVMQALYGVVGAGTIRQEGMATFETVNRAMESLATVLTDHVRADESVCGAASVRGTVHEDELYIAVNWLWLLPAMVILALCLAFFGATIVVSWRDDLWKSSPYAYLLNRPQSGDRKLETEHLLSEGVFDVDGRRTLNEDVKVRFEAEARLRKMTREW